MSPKATPSSQPPASTTTSEMSPKVTPSSHPSSSTIAPPPVTEEVGSGPPVAAIGGAVGCCSRVSNHWSRLPHCHGSSVCRLEEEVHS